jgi:hypothetical protein
MDKQCPTNIQANWKPKFQEKPDPGGDAHTHTHERDTERQRERHKHTILCRTFDTAH